MIPTTEISHKRPSEVHRRTRIELLTVCNLHWKHGLEFAIQAIDQLRRQGVDLHYAIIGDGPLFEAVGFSRHDLNLHEQVSIVRDVKSESIRYLVERADLYLSPRVAPVLDDGLVVASQCGVPIVCTDVDRPPATDLVPGYCAVVPRRDPGAIAQGVIRWLEVRGGSSSWM